MLIYGLELLHTVSCGQAFVLGCVFIDVMVCFLNFHQSSGPLDAEPEAGVRVCVTIEGGASSQEEAVGK